MTYGVTRNENTEIVCEVDAYPAPDKFKWTFNRTGATASSETNELIQQTRAGTDIGSIALGADKRDKLSAVFTYNPSGHNMVNVGADNDYGTVTCRASNTAGQQVEPCVFHVIAAGEYCKNKSFPRGEGRNFYFCDCRFFHRYLLAHIDFFKRNKKSVKYIEGKLIYIYTQGEPHEQRF